jgi:hypothetical protein
MQLQNLLLTGAAMLSAVNADCNAITASIPGLMPAPTPADAKLASAIVSYAAGLRWPLANAQMMCMGEANLGPSYVTAYQSFATTAASYYSAHSAVINSLVPGGSCTSLGTLIPAASATAVSAAMIAGYCNAGGYTQGAGGSGSNVVINTGNGGVTVVNGITIGGPVNWSGTATVTVAGVTVAGVTNAILTIPGTTAAGFTTTITGTGTSPMPTGNSAQIQSAGAISGINIGATAGSSSTIVSGSDGADGESSSSSSNGANGANGANAASKSTTSATPTSTPTSTSTVKSGASLMSEVNMAAVGLVSFLVVMAAL